MLLPAIDFALARGLKRVEAGAQGGHKLARGYLPQRTRSFHWIAHDGFRDAVDRFLKEERRYVAEELRFGDAPGRFKATLNLDALRGGAQEPRSAPASAPGAPAAGVRAAFDG